MPKEELIPKCEVVLDSLKDVVLAFQPSHPFWISHYPNAWIFRGHAMEKWELSPSVFRADIREDYGLNSVYGINLQRVVESEFELIHEFSLLCDSAGLQLPEQAYTYIMNPEKRQFNPDDKEGYRRFPEIELQHIMALAQHHGLPTRLLDFSYDPLAALFFAAERPKINLEGNKYFVVYALNRVNVSSVGRYKEIHAPSYANENLKQQKGLFVLDKLAYEALEGGALPPSMEGVLKKVFNERLDRDKDVLLKIESDHYFYRKILIPEELRLDVLKHLHKRHYNRAHLLPSYNSVTSTIRILPHMQPAAWRK